ncbi:MAG: heme-binding domain-containing protein [Chlorobiaceae bacterium]|nr:heme-binding domain-containing protein [Chlorobiaceae bacterium]
MNYTTKSIASWTVLALMLMQAVPLNRINPPVTNEIPVQAPVKNALKKACYDCHSNETNWHGIAYIAPFSWFTSITVNEGRSAINFSAWNNKNGWKYLASRPEINAIFTQANSHHREYYLWNPEAKLTHCECTTLSAWYVSLEKERQAFIHNAASSGRDSDL